MGVTRLPWSLSFCQLLCISLGSAGAVMVLRLFFSFRPSRTAVFSSEMWPCILLIPSYSSLLLNDMYFVFYYASPVRNFCFSILLLLQLQHILFNNQRSLCISRSRCFRFLLTKKKGLEEEERGCRSGKDEMM